MVAVRPSKRVPVLSSTGYEGVRDLGPEAADPATASTTSVLSGVRTFLGKSTTYGRMLKEEKWDAVDQAQGLPAVLSPLCVFKCKQTLGRRSFDNLPVRAQVWGSAVPHS